MRVVIWVGAALLTVSGFARAENREESTFQCRGGIVRVGDPEYEVREKCGAPRTVGHGDSGPILIYDSGPTSFVRSVYVTDGKVSRIEGGDYGTARPAPVRPSAQ